MCTHGFRSLQSNKLNLHTTCVQSQVKVITLLWRRGLQSQEEVRTGVALKWDKPRLGSDFLYMLV